MANYRSIDSNPKNRFENVQRTSLDLINNQHDQIEVNYLNETASGNEQSPVRTVKVTGTQSLFGIQRRESKGAVLSDDADERRAAN